MITVLECRAPVQVQRGKTLHCIKRIIAKTKYNASDFVPAGVFAAATQGSTCRDREPPRVPEAPEAPRKCIR